MATRPLFPRCSTANESPARHFEFLAGADERLDVLVAAEGDLSRTQAATLIATRQVTVDGRHERASYRPRPGQRVSVDVPAPPGRDVVAESIPLHVVFEDEWLLVVDKPAGMVVHPAPGHWSGTLANALVGRPSGASRSGPEAGGQSAAPRAGIVHRLDKDTSGLLLVAKSDHVHRRLTAALAERRIRRLYAALAWGHLSEDRLTVDQPVGRDPRDRKRMAIVSTGRPARTDFVRLARFDAADLLRARLSTGRTHQIRVHLASVGHPIVGDDVYGAGGKRRVGWLEGRRHFLHAAWLTFRHPVSGEVLDLRSPLPPDLQAAVTAAAGGDGGGSGRGGRVTDGPNLEGDVLEHVGFYRLDD